jgi:toxin ParE1/3/4
VAEPEFRLTPRAERDLQDIWRYTARRWSLDQAEIYISSLLDTLDALAQEPTLGRAAEDIRRGYRRQNSGSHVIFYKTEKYGVAVIRILHQRMNLASHFDPD